MVLAGVALELRVWRCVCVGVGGGLCEGLCACPCQNQCKTAEVRRF